jgi:uncharacterized membrane protein
MNDIYKAPEADLTLRTTSVEGSGSLEGGIAGNYSFSIGEVISEAWAKTDGAKGTIWLGLLFYVLVMVAVSIPFVIAKSQILSQIAQTIAGMPLMAGLYIIVTKIALGKKAKASEVFAYLGKFLPILLTVILLYIMVVIGFVLLIIPGIYLTVAYGFALPLVVDKNLGAWEALEASRKAVTHHWFKFFGLYLVLLLIMFVSAIPLGIGLIWTIPLIMIAYGILYAKMFGLENN